MFEDIYYLWKYCFSGLCNKIILNETVKDLLEFSAGTL